MLTIPACVDSTAPDPSRVAPPAAHVGTADGLATIFTEEFVRAAGAPQNWQRSIDVTGYGAPFVLRVAASAGSGPGGGRGNAPGGGPGGGPATGLAATVTLDGVTLLTPAVSGGGGAWEFDVAPQGTASLTVQLSGPPGGSLLVELAGTPQVSAGASIAAGAVAQTNRFCALRSDGSAVCWGTNFAGQLGIGDPGIEFSAEPVVVTGGHTFRALSGGANHTCGLRTDGSVWCWGNNVQSQLGHGPGPHRFEPVRVAGDVVFTTISGDGNTTCGLDADGAAWCWGNNANGQTGTGTAGGVIHEPSAVATSHRFVTVDVGPGHACALTAAGQAYCWGFNVQGQLGTATAGTQSSVPIPVDGGHAFGAISAGLGMTCGLSAADGSAWCWGTGPLGGAASPSATPAPVSGGVLFAALSVSWGVVCGIERGTHAAWCWGSNEYGQLGTGDFIDRATPAPAAAGLGFRALAANQQTVCGVATTADVYCWGAARSGVLGNGQFDHESLTPLPVAGGHDFRIVVATRLAGVTCGLTTAGDVWCWGSEHGWREPTPLAGVPSLATLSAGGLHFCGLTADGAAWCWQANNLGQLGLGTATPGIQPPTELPGGHVFRALHTGVYQSCGLDHDDLLWCWGTNFHGAFGNGTQSNVPSGPVAAGGGIAFHSVSDATLTHMCGIDLTGVTLCWGGNGAGEVGDGTTSPRLSPTPVADSHSFRLVQTSASSNVFGCALDHDDAAWCWGSNAGAALGDGTTTHRNRPTAVLGGHAFEQLALGSAFSCGVTAAGSAWCWGQNTTGRLGDGTKASPLLAPAPAADGLALQSLTIGAQHACGITTSGTTWCWGSNSSGQLGGLGPFVQPSPVLVLGGHSYLMP